MLQGWVGPAVVAALIAALVSAAGWFVSAGLNLRAEQRRREEKVRDFRIALRAEIRSELAGLRMYDGEAELTEIERRLAQDADYRILMPRMGRHVIVEAIVPELFILPENVIDPVVLYLHRRDAVVSFSEDIRLSAQVSKNAAYELELYRDFVSLRSRLADAAVDALDALEKNR